MRYRRSNPSNHVLPDYIGEATIGQVVEEDVLRSWPNGLKVIAISDLAQSLHESFCDEIEHDGAGWARDVEIAEGVFERLPKVELWVRRYSEGVRIAAKQYRNHKAA